jgi:hypothetical protein
MDRKEQLPELSDLDKIKVTKPIVNKYTVNDIISNDL